MDVLQWAIDPRGHSVPIHIAWSLIQVAFVSAVAFLGRPMTARSTDASRSGRAATAFTAILMRSMRSPESAIADATLSSGKSQTCRSRIFSK